MSTPNPVKALALRAINTVVGQNSLAWDEDEKRCRLRTDSGLCCAVGATINDEFYEFELEAAADPSFQSNKTLRLAIAQSNPELHLDAADFQKDYWAMLSKMQSIHDNADDVMEFEVKARKMLERDFNTKLPKVTK